MKRISLTQGYHTLVDDEDFERLSKYRWKVLKNGNKFYATRSKHLGKGHYTTIYMHREILESPTTVDHINGDGLDNQRNNLRIATSKQQAMNRIQLKTKTGFKGVDKRGNRYRAYIGVPMRYLGNFDTSKEAAIAYNKAAIEMYGEFASLNNV